MKQSEVKIGSVYQVKVSGVLKAVRVDEKELVYTVSVLHMPELDILVRFSPVAERSV